jgi:hypothetical protein
MRTKKFACGCPTLFLSLLLLGTPMSAAMAAPAVQGQWSTLTNLAPINLIHAALLPNGKVLIIAGSGNCPPSQPGCPAGAPYNPTTNGSGAILYDPLAKTLIPLSLSLFMRLVTYS